MNVHRTKATHHTTPPGLATTEPPPRPTTRRRLLPVSGKRPGPVAVTVLFSLGWVFMYADRNILSPVMSVIQDQWGLNRGQLGLMSTVFFLTYALMQIPTGYLADRIGRVRWSWPATWSSASAPSSAGSPPAS